MNTNIIYYAEFISSFELIQPYFFVPLLFKVFRLTIKSSHILKLKLKIDLKK